MCADVCTKQIVNHLSGNLLRMLAVSARKSGRTLQAPLFQPPVPSMPTVFPINPRPEPNYSCEPDPDAWRGPVEEGDDPIATSPFQRYRIHT